MMNLILRIEHDLRQLRTAVTRQDEEQIDRLLPALQRGLLSDQAYRTIWDEQLLVKVLQVLSECYDAYHQDQLNDIRDHLRAVRAVHDKLFAILDPNMSIDVLVFQQLYEWPHLDEPVNCHFEQEDMRTLEALRASGATEQRLRRFLDFYFQRLAANNQSHIVETIQPSVEHALEAYIRAPRATVYGLFAIASRGEVHGIVIRESAGVGNIQAMDRIDPEMEKAAKRALESLLPICPQVRAYDFKWEILRDDISFAGNSIGLALAAGFLARVEDFDIDSYTAFTGHVDWQTGAVQRIEYLHEKLGAAKELGIRRVFIPSANASECQDIEGMQIIPIESLAQLREYLRRKPTEQVGASLEQLAAVRINQLTAHLRTRGIHQVSCVQRELYCKRVAFTDYQHEVFVDVFHAKRLNPQVQLKKSTLQDAVQEACNIVFGRMEAGTPVEHLTTPTQKTQRYPVKDPRMQQRIEQYLFQLGDAVREAEQSCTYRAKITKARQVVLVKQYTNGTLLLQGPTPLFDEINMSIRAVLGISEEEGEIADPHQARVAAQIKAVESIELGEQWIGTDEAGKGDYFGPLVGAAVFVDGDIARQLERLGVKDSKALSDKRVVELAASIRVVCGQRAQVVLLVPERYNELYTQFRSEHKNLNTLLAWVHARALQNLLQHFPQRRITVIIDKFADEHYIHDQLRAAGRKTLLDLKQLPKAEANIAVAAASILARAQFLHFLEGQSKSLGVNLPKGASDPRIVEVARTIIARYGRDRLEKVAKLHFKTTQQVLQAT